MDCMKRCGLVILMIVLAILLFAPPIVGLIIEKNVPFASLADLNHFDVQVLQYKRGWFSSDITFKLKSNHSELKNFLENMQRAPANTADDIELTMQGHIQHGPIFYRRIKNSPCMGLALMTRRFASPVQQSNLLTYLGLNASILRANYAYLNFTGKYFDYFELQNFRLVSPEGIKIQFNHLKMKISLDEAGNRVQGLMKLTHFKVWDGNTLLILPQANIQFNMQKEVEGLWIGSEDISLSRLEMHDSNQTISLAGINLKGAIHEARGLISGDKQFNIKKIEFEGQPIGALQLSVRVKSLHAKAISDLITTYQDTLRHGEMYEFQLKQRMLAHLPELINSNTLLQLDKLNLQTPDGQLHLAAAISWPNENKSSFSAIEELAASAKIKADLKVSIPFAERLISLLSKLTYMFQLSLPQRQVLLDLQETIRGNMQLSGYTILNLIENKQLPKEEGVELLAQIRDSVPLVDFQEEVKKLLMLRKVDLVTSHQLIFLYTVLTQEFDAFDQEIQSYQKAAEQQIQAQINQSIQAGLIAQDKNNYKVSLVRDQNGLIINGHGQ